MNKTVLGTTLFVCGSLLLLSWAKVINFSSGEITGAAAGIFGLLNINYSLNTNNRQMIVFSTILFLVGIIFSIKDRIEIFDYHGLVFISILFVSGASFILLFINSPKEKAFLYSGVTLFFLSYLSIEVLRPIGLFDLTSKIDGLLSIFWHVILILLGIVLFVGRKK